MSSDQSNQSSIPDFKITVDCPICNKKELNVVNKEISLMQCISCGYSTSEDYKGTRKDNSNFDELDESMKKWSKESRGHIWIPSVLNLSIGLYYPIEEKKSMKWAFAPLVNVKDSDKENYKKEDGSYYDHRYDMDNQLIFNKFYQGILEINMIMELRSRGNNSSDTKLPSIDG